jgi:hypothetical protein
MAMKRDATKVIWRTVVFAGAMLGAPACSKKQAQTTPAPKPVDTATTTTTTTTDPTTAADPQPDPAADPAPDDCRVRGCDEDGGGGAGRGFVLS